MSTQLTLGSVLSSPSKIGANHSTFTPNLKLPVHRWFRFTAGFSAEWVEQVLEDLPLSSDGCLFDPFAGSGTTLLAADRMGVKSLGVEAHTFVYRVAGSKLHWDSDPREFVDLAAEIHSRASGDHSIVSDYPELIERCFPPPVLTQLDALRKAYEETRGSRVCSDLLWLCLTSILRACSPVGTANMELIQPRKSKKNALQPLEAFRSQVQLMANDMRTFQDLAEKSRAEIYLDDARSCQAVPDCSVDLVLTSPPYANNFDYADATRLELSFWGEVSGWKDLHSTIRHQLIVSCTQHANAEKLSLEEVLSRPGTEAIGEELGHVCEQLAKERLLHGGKKNYHLMVAAYFSDMAATMQALRRVCRKGSRICLVIGDSAPYGIYVPVDRWLGELAVDSGFLGFRFEKTRDRNTKWKNRKHRVPLHEGHLWIDG